MTDLFGVKQEPLLADATPIEMVTDRISVKREDLCSPHPGPSFSKIRGVLKHIEKRAESEIGVLDTYHSKAGWAVSYVSHHLGKKALDFYPRYKDDGPELRLQQKMAAQYGAELFELTAGRSAILYHRARKECNSRGAYLMPNALKLPETVEECAEEVLRTPDLHRYANLVISVSSGTIASGVLRGFAKAKIYPNVWLHAGYSRSESELRRYIATKVPKLTFWPSDVNLVDEKYGYKDAAKVEDPPPFPCNPYYDLKAWKWLGSKGVGAMKGSVLFWNIGA